MSQPRIAVFAFASLTLFSSLDTLASPQLSLSPNKAVAVDNASIKLRPTYQKCLDASAANTFVMLDCSADEFAFQDERLNASYKKIMATLNTSQREALRTEEREWIVHKSKLCELEEDPGQGQQVVSADCEVGETAKRATEIESRIK